MVLDIYFMIMKKERLQLVKSRHGTIPLLYYTDKKMAFSGKVRTIKKKKKEKKIR